MDKLRGDEIPTFTAYISQSRKCERCGADYDAHGSRLECPAWALEAKFMVIKESSKE